MWIILVNRKLVEIYGISDYKFYYYFKGVNVSGVVGFF